MTQVVTPAMVEKRLYDLSKEIDTAHQDLIEAEGTYFRVKAEYELALAKSRLSLRQPVSKLTVQDKADMALVACDELHMQMATAEAIVRAARANAQRIRTQVDIARSVGTSVRTGMDV